MDTQKKIVITAGGTGGHMIPAQAFAEQLIKRGDRVVFIGGKLDENKYFDKSRYTYAAISCSTLSWKSPWKAIAGAFKIIKGIFQARRLLKREKPHNVVGFGSYHTLPVILAAKWLKIPIYLHEGNSIPGRVNSFASRFAIATGVHFPEALKHLKGPCEEIPLPIRKGVTTTQQEARACFGLKEDKAVILVIGGSQGAQVLNHAVPKILAHRKEQVIHLAGDAAAVAILEEEYQKLGIEHNVMPFTQEMAIAWQAADIVIGRGGAATLAEMEYYGVPGVIIPYPQAMDNHQWHNGRYLEKIGGAIVLQQEEMTYESLKSSVAHVLNHRLKMRAALLKHSAQRQMRPLEQLLR